MSHTSTLPSGFRRLLPDLDKSVRNSNDDGPSDDLVVVLQDFGLEPIQVARRSRSSRSPSPSAWRASTGPAQWLRASTRARRPPRGGTDTAHGARHHGTCSAPTPASTWRTSRVDARRSTSWSLAVSRPTSTPTAEVAPSLRLRATRHDEPCRLLCGLSRGPRCRRNARLLARWTTRSTEVRLPAELERRRVSARPWRLPTRTRSVRPTTPGRFSRQEARKSNDAGVVFLAREVAGRGGV